MCTLGKWQLKSIEIQYSQTSMKSLGMRYFLQLLLPRWRRRNPQVNITINHHEYLPPQGSFFFADGSTKIIRFSKLKGYQIEKIFTLYRNSANANHFLSTSGSRLWSERRSIQGLWKPTLEGQMKALAFCFRRYKNQISPRYSSESLQLSQQAVEGKGRWGNSNLFPRGWDTFRLQNVLCKPFIIDPSPST